MRRLILAGALALAVAPASASAADTPSAEALAKRMAGTAQVVSRITTS